jgi:cytoskeletal protein CcmA (bactofilin family)
MASDNVIGAGTRLEGSIFFDGHLLVQGAVNGSLTSETTGTLVVAEGGVVEGDVEVGRVEANGRLSGRIGSRESLKLGPHAQVSGSVHYAHIETESGSVINAELVYREAQKP